MKRPPQSGIKEIKNSNTNFSCNNLKRNFSHTTEINYIKIIKKIYNKFKNKLIKIQVKSTIKKLLLSEGRSYHEY